MKQLLKLIAVFILILLYTCAIGAGWAIIYNVGLRTAVMPIYELPILPTSSFIIIYSIILCIGSLVTLSSDKNRKKYNLTDPEPYSKLISNILTLYMFVGVIWLFSLMFA
jgi:hypothetical protein